MCSFPAPRSHQHRFDDKNLEVAGQTLLNRTENGHRPHAQNHADALLTDPMRVEMFAAGGVMLMGLGIGSVLEIKPIRVANLTALGLPIGPSF